MSSATTTGRQKAAILLVSLGAEASAEVFKHLRQDEIDELTLEIAGIGHVPQERSRRWSRSSTRRPSPRTTSRRAAWSTPRATPGEGPRLRPGKRRDDAAVRLDPGQPVRVPTAHRRPARSSTSSQHEHPQTIALVMAYLPPETAAPGRELAARPPPVRGRDARSRDGPHAPEVIREIERVMERKLSSVINQDFTSAAACCSLVDLLNQVDRDHRAHHPGVPSRSRTRSWPTRSAG